MVVPGLSLALRKHFKLQRMKAASDHFVEITPIT